MNSLFHYKEINNHAERTLFTFHGTGGSEDDFLFFDGLLKQQWNIVGIRGNVDEQGMRRFFKREAFGVFDTESISEESEKLQQFITNWYTEKKTSKEQCVFLGYSNGANMILSLLFRYPELLRTVVLLHPMLPFVPKETAFSANDALEALVTTGANDQLIGAAESCAVIETLQGLQIHVTHREYSGGHEIGQQEIQDIIQFLQDKSS